MSHSFWRIVQCLANRNTQRILLLSLNAQLNYFQVFFLEVVMNKALLSPSIEYFFEYDSDSGRMSTPKHLTGSWKHYSAVPRTIWQNGCPFGCPKLCWEGFWGCIWPPQERALPSINDVCQGEGVGGSSEWPHICPGESPIGQPPLKTSQGWVRATWAISEGQSFHRALKCQVTQLSEEYLVLRWHEKIMLIPTWTWKLLKLNHACLFQILAIKGAIVGQADQKNPH